jgi:hypothetical protein
LHYFHESRKCFFGAGFGSLFEIGDHLALLFWPQLISGTTRAAWPLVHVVERLPPFWGILSLYNCLFDESFAIAVRSEPISCSGQGERAQMAGHECPWREAGG